MMTTVRLPPDLYIRQLRVLGAWWRLGSSALHPDMLVESNLARSFDPAEVELAGHGGVALTY